MKKIIKALRNYTRDFHHRPMILLWIYWSKCKNNCNLKGINWQFTKYESKDIDCVPFYLPSYVDMLFNRLIIKA